ncbi:hypothetical protein Desmu_0052 [Desulfurococcus mucosus DSM 2162]|uniref:Uncharacterized protein n=2 Tax=Desulfurococcus mucosus TaxID=2275 RepID=E8RAG1_DESM0|nr:hypothetical protein Desmu_0052 [Desulfurococcus mucosus DSM 2162]
MHHETLFPRHFTGDLSSCRRIKELTLEEASSILPPEAVSRLLSGREVIVVEPGVVKKIAEIEVGDEYIVLKPL